MDQLQSMRIFVLAMERGSFAAAAEVLAISGPMVGKHVSALENSLGVRFINRTTRRHAATEMGVLYYERCKVVLSEVAAAEAMVAEGASPRGTLRVSMPVHLGRHCIAPILIAVASEPSAT